MAQQENGPTAQSDELTPYLPVRLHSLIPLLELLARSLVGAMSSLSKKVL